MCIFVLQGDSWTIAFHDAEDAVAFGLQVSQSIQRHSQGMPLQHAYQVCKNLVACTHPAWQYACGAYVPHGHIVCGAVPRDRLMLRSAKCVVDARGCFVLQVQQALSEKVWSLRMTPGASSHHTTRAHHGSQTTQTSEPSVASSYCLIGSGTATPPLSAGGPRVGSMTGAFGRLHDSFTAASSDRGSSVAGMRSRECSFTAGPGQHGDVEVGGAGLEPGRDPLLLQQPVSKHVFQVDDTRGGKDSGPQLLQQQSETLPPQHQGKNASRNGHAQHKPLPTDSHDHPVSPFTEQHCSQSTQWSGSGTTGQSPRATSRLYSAGSALMSRLSRVVRSNLSGSGLLHPYVPDVHDVQELRLSVRIGIATGWLLYGCSLEGSAVTERAKSECHHC